jgi:hypothetical protein
VVTALQRQGWPASPLIESQSGSSSGTFRVFMNTTHPAAQSRLRFGLKCLTMQCIELVITHLVVCLSVCLLWHMLGRVALDTEHWQLCGGGDLLTNLFARVCLA